MSFGAVAAEYDRLRPTAPPEAISWLLPARRDVVVDLGAGTGLLARALAGQVGHVVAVEPDERMRAILAARSGDVTALTGRGEAIPLPDASADVVVVSSAWHWMDPAQAEPEIARVLRDDGRLAVLWTSRDPDIPWLHADEWFREAREEEAAAIAAEARATKDQAAKDRAAPWRGRRGRRCTPEGHHEVRLPGSTLFRNIETKEFRFGRYLRIADIVAMLATYSDVITASPQAQLAGRARAAAALAAQFPAASELEVPMLTYCWRGDRVPR